MKYLQYNEYCTCIYTIEWKLIYLRENWQIVLINDINDNNDY